MPKYNIDESRQIAIVWDIIDVQQERPDLDDKEAMEVLILAEDKHDANYGIGWETLREHADYLFPNCKKCPYDGGLVDRCSRRKEGEDGVCEHLAQCEAQECENCALLEAECNFEADADGNCRNYVPRNMNPRI